MENGTVTLTGVLPDPLSRDAAVEAARLAPGGVEPRERLVIST